MSQRSRREFITLQRRSLDSWIWDMPAEQTKTAITLMLMANWKDGKTFSGGELVIVRRGQLMTSLDAVSARARVSKQTVRTTLRNLEKAGFLTCQSTNRFRLLTIVNYCREQDLESDEIEGHQHATNTHSNTPLARHQHAIGTQPTPQQLAEESAISNTPDRGHSYPASHGKPDTDAPAPTGHQHAVNTPLASDRHATGTPLTPIEPSNQVIRESRDQGNQEREGARDVIRELADQLWQEQEDLRSNLKAEGIGTRTRSLGLTSPAKVDLMHRISESLATNRTLGDVRDDCRHVLAVLADEARAKQTLRWLDGGHWKTDRFNAALAIEPGESPGRTEPESGHRKVSDFSQTPSHPSENTPEDLEPYREKGDSPF